MASLKSNQLYCRLAPKTCFRDSAKAHGRIVPNTRLLSSTTGRWKPSSVGGHGLAEDAQVGAQTAEPLTIEGIKARRIRAGRLVAPTASYSDSDMFKSPHAYTNPKARRWDHLLTDESKARRPCVLKQAAKHLKQPGLISLGGGLPSAANFPFDSLSMRIPAPPSFSEQDTKASGRTVTIGKRDAAADGAAEYDLSIGLNYGQSGGSAQLLRWATEHTELVHSPPYSDWRCALTIGATGSLEAAYRMFCDGRGRRDSIVTEEYSFSTALETAAPLGIAVFGVRMDGEGLLPEDLDAVLRRWDDGKAGGGGGGGGGARKPSVLYTVPSGQNPTGATQGEQRRRDIYQVCCDHDLIIIEDEPYYFLQMPPYSSSSTSPDSASSSSPLPQPPQSVDDFLTRLLPSYLSLDTQGRVMRHDSLSKVLVPGARLGWVTASEQVVERYVRHAECASQGPSGFSQLVVHRLLDEGQGEWGHEGYLRWLMHLAGEYAARRDAMLAACERYLLPDGLVSWDPPAAGMFLWLRVDHTKHPDAGTRDLLDIEEDIFNSCIQNGVLACRGSWFRAEQDRPLAGLFFRTTFASASPDEMATAVQRFGDAVRTSFRR